MHCGVARDKITAVPVLSVVLVIAVYDFKLATAERATDKTVLYVSKLYALNLDVTYVAILTPPPYPKSAFNI